MTGNDPLFWNKLALAVLCAVALAWVTNALVGVLYHPQPLDKPAYMIAGDAPAAKPAGKPVAEAGTPAKPAAPDSTLAMLAAADAAKGEKIARKCAACHSFDKGGPNKVGPPLWDIVGAKQAAAAYKFSSALKGLGGTWDYAALDAFLRKPKEYVKGTKMSFAGIANAKDRADLLGYLRGLSDSPKPLP